MAASLFLARKGIRGMLGSISCDPNPIVNTFSMAALDMRNGDLGVVVASRVFAVGAVVPYAKAGVDAVATQSVANVTYGPDGLERMATGASPESVIQGLTSEDPVREQRQVGMVNSKGQSFAFTGKDAADWKGHLYGEGFACQGNLLAGEAVLAEMVRAFGESDRGLSERLMAALLAGDRAGGDRRGRQSAAILVVRQGVSSGWSGDRYLDLRVDHGQDARNKLSTVFKWWKQPRLE